jgi:NodT family efflux transporter outer membrane factor (OMF) lipoprotein
MRLVARYIRPSAILLALLALAGCAAPRAWWANGWKVGPNYCPPPAAVAEDWIDAADVRLRHDGAEPEAWWTVFGDPLLDELIGEAYAQNLTVREAGFRILQARAQRAIAAGNLFPQQQQVFADYSHIMQSETVPRIPIPDRHFSIWDAGFNLSWELDFWGRFRRAIEAADGDLEASVANYDDVVVTLLADVAATYIEIRTLQRRLRLADANVKAMRGSHDIAAIRFRDGATSEIDVQQAITNLTQTEALVPTLQIALRQANNRLCVLLGRPPEDLATRLGTGMVPRPPNHAIVGIPADLLRRRPDVRRAERELAAQSARIGVAESELYPHIAINGVLGVEARQFADLFDSGASFGSVGPSLRWNILNYGRLINNIAREDARFGELASRYEQSVLRANQEAEDAIVAFLKSQERLASLDKTVTAAQRTNDLVMLRYHDGKDDFNRVYIVQSFLVQQEDSAAQAAGEVATNLIRLYRSLGGGWQIRKGVMEAPARETVTPSPQPPEPPADSAAPPR